MGEHPPYEVMPPLVRLRDIAERLEWEAGMVGSGDAAQERRLSALAAQLEQVRRELWVPDELVLLSPPSSVDEGNTPDGI